MGGLDRQVTLECLSGLSAVRGLSENQRKIVSLLNCGLCQADIAKKLKFSRAYVCQTVKRLESIGEIKAKPVYEKVPGKRSYTKFYELSPDLISRIKGGRVAEPFTACRVHNLRKKISIVSQSSVPSLDKRTGYQKSWTMRGGDRHKFWFSGKAGMPSVTVDWHIKSLIVYVDKKQHIIARTPEEAMETGWRAIYQAVDAFIELQRKFGVQIAVEHVGETVGKPHGGFVGSESKSMQDGVTREHWWIDRSQETELGPGHPELETDQPENMTRLDNLIKVSEQVDLVQLPEMFKGMIDPLNDKMVQLVSQLQGGRPIEQMFQNALDMMLRMMEKMDKMDAELKALKSERK